MAGRTTLSAIFVGISLVAFGTGCVPLSQPVSQREQGAAIGALTGGASGAIVGSLAGSAVAGGLFGMPIGAVAGYYIGDRMAQAEQQNQAQIDERRMELERLRRENERLRFEGERQGSTRQGEPSRDLASSETEREPAGDRRRSRSARAEQAEQEAPESRRAGLGRPETIRRVQTRLNEMGFHAGPVDGIAGPITKSAIKNFQTSKGLEPTGRLNDETAEALDIEN